MKKGKNKSKSGQFKLTAKTEDIKGMVLELQMQKKILQDKLSKIRKLIYSITKK